LQINCPDCGYELQDMAQQLRQDAGNDTLDLFNKVVGYYCSSCNDFYGPDEL
jgi:hypothetical protein